MLGLLPHLNFSTDAAILLAIVLIIMGGVLLGQHKVKTFALSIYVGIVLATQLGDPIFQFLVGRGLTFGSFIGIAKLRLALLGLPIILLELGHNKQHRGQRRGVILTLILSVLTAALLVATVIGLLEPEARQAVLEGSSLASILYGLRLWWIGLVPTVAIAESFAKPKRD